MNEGMVTLQTMPKCTSNYDNPNVWIFGAYGCVLEEEGANPN